MRKNIIIGIMVGLLVFSVAVVGAGYSRYKNSGASCNSDGDCFGGLICRNQACSERVIVKNTVPKIVSTRAVGTSLLNAAKEHQTNRITMRGHEADPRGRNLYKNRDYLESPKEAKKKVRDLEMKKKVKVSTKYYKDTGSKARPYDYKKVTGKAVKKLKSISPITGLILAGGQCDPQAPRCEAGLRCNPSLRICTRITPTD